GWSIDSSPLSSPASSPQPTTPTQSVSIVPTPDVVDITVNTTTPTTTPTTTAQQKPPPVQAPPPPPQTTTASTPPQQGLLVNEGASCGPEGASGIGLLGEPLECRKDGNRGNRLRWHKV
ncbi:MAG TPA: hypothetical protein VF821_11530, partial [Lentzea sp.]